MSLARMYALGFMAFIAVQQSRAAEPFTDDCSNTRVLGIALQQIFVPTPEMEWGPLFNWSALPPGQMLEGVPHPFPWHEARIRQRYHFKGNYAARLVQTDGDTVYCEAIISKSYELFDFEIGPISYSLNKHTGLVLSSNRSAQYKDQCSSEQARSDIRRNFELGYVEEDLFVRKMKDSLESCRKFIPLLSSWNYWALYEGRLPPEARDFLISHNEPAKPIRWIRGIAATYGCFDTYEINREISSAGIRDSARGICYSDPDTFFQLEDAIAQISLADFLVRKAYEIERAP